MDELVAENLPLSLLEERAPAEAGPEAEGLVGMLEALQGSAGNEAVTALLEELGLDGGKSGESDTSAEVVEPGEEPPGPPEAGVEEAGGSAGEGTGGGDGAGGAGDGEGGEDHSKELDQIKADAAKEAGAEAGVGAAVGGTAGVGAASRWQQPERVSAAP